MDWSVPLITEWDLVSSWMNFYSRNPLYLCRPVPQIALHNSDKVKEFLSTGTCEELRWPFGVNTFLLSWVHSPDIFWERTNVCAYRFSFLLLIGLEGKPVMLMNHMRLLFGFIIFPLHFTEKKMEALGCWPSQIARKCWSPAFQTPSPVLFFYTMLTFPC